MIVEYILTYLVLFFAMIGAGALRFGLTESRSSSQAFIQYAVSSAAFTLAYLIFNILKG